MKNRNLKAVLIGIPLSFALAFAGSSLAWLLLIGPTRPSSDKDALITLMLVQSLVMVPLVAVLVGVFVGLIAGRQAWKLAGVTLLPLLITSLIPGDFYFVELALSILYLLLGIAAAYAGARLARYIHC